jgi:hypothetical protein
LNSTIHILDSGNGKPIFVEIISKNGLSASSTIGQFLDDPSLYIDLANENEIPSELEKIEEDGKVGWRILGRVPDNYGPIGQGAIDLSNSTILGALNGATEEDSVATGRNTEASGMYSFTAGLNTIASGSAEMAIGKFNDSPSVTAADRMLVIGGGTMETNRQNILEVFDDGQIIAPGLDASEIANGSGNQLTTKDYVDDVDGGDL